MSKTLLILGGLGFIGSNLCNYFNRLNKYKIVIVDKNTYAADIKNLDFQPEAVIIRDICNGIEDVLTTYKPEIIINLIAESHVDNSINSSYVFWQTNVMGTHVFMEQMARIVPDSILIHFSCYDHETKALTKDGLKNYDELKEGDIVLSINAKTNLIEEKSIEKVIIQDYKGDMIHFKSSLTDMLVTPNHRMFYQYKINNNQLSEIKINEAKSLLNKVNLYFPKGKWEGRDLNTTYVKGIGDVDTQSLFYICGIFLGDGFTAYQEKKVKNKSGLLRKDYVNLSRDIKTGKFIAGTRGNNKHSLLKSYRIFFDIPEKDKGRKRLEETLNNLKINWHSHKGKAGEHIYFSSKEWMEFFDSNLGKGFYDKKIPYWMLQYDYIYLKALFDGMIDSDGNYHKKNGTIAYATSSPHIRDSIFELSFKLGFQPRSRTRYKKGDKVFFKKENRYINVNHDSYWINFRKGNIGLSSDKAKIIPYEDKIWCLKVKDNANFLTYRNGILAISGNTDECYGPFIKTDTAIVDFAYREDHKYNPVSPYAYSKVAQELAVKSSVKNYDLKNVLIVRPNNIFGPRQHLEKFIPTIISRILQDKPIPVYGDGKQQRPWLYIDDLCQAISELINNRKLWDKDSTDDFFIYNISARKDNERFNIDLVKEILTLLDKPDTLISYVEDRKNHDVRYFTDDFNFRFDFGWEPKVELTAGLLKTIEYYKDKLNVR